MKKQKILGLSLSIIGIFLLLTTILILKKRSGISDNHALLIASSLALMMSGISVYQNARNYTKRSNFIKFSFPITISIIIIGIILMVSKLPLSRILIILGVFFLCFSITPVIAKNRYIRWKNYTQSRLQIIGLMIADSLGIIFILLSFLFYIQKWPGYFFFGISGLTLLIVAFLLWNRKFENLFSFQLEAEAKLKKQHKEILDSINYAKRIQSAILPPSKIIKEYLKNSFILYIPKDIVAGDFYWLEQVKNKTLFGVCDCTGHGVPGALISIVCNNALNRSVREFKLSDPGKILDKTRKLVIEEFKKSEEDINDGMDIALCSIDNNQLKYAGAHNPLWIIKNGELIEIKANKQPIGKYDKIDPYKTHTIELKKDDCVYIFSDGYIDQFGGERNKKFKASKFRELLLSVNKNSMEKQKSMIHKTFIDWKGNNEQIDDVCIIGLKI